MASHPSGFRFWFDWSWRERLVCNSIVFEKNTSRGSINSFTECWHHFLKSSSAYSAVFVALSWASFPFSTCEGKVLTPFKLNVGCVFSICDWQVSFANIYSINHLKPPYFCCLAFCIPDNAELFPGDVIKIVRVNDYLAGLKLAEFWLSFPKCAPVLSGQVWSKRLLAFPFCSSPSSWLC